MRNAKIFHDFKFFIKTDIYFTYTTQILLSKGNLNDNQDIMFYTYQDKIDTLLGNQEKE